MKTAMIAACIAGAALSLPAYAYDAHKDEKAGHKMEMMDTNKDGMVSHDEHKAAMDKKFAAADTNGDGMLSATEKAAKKLDMKDANDDGSVTRDEFNAVGESKFTAADTNKDNMLSKDEMMAMWKAHH
jgi:hypothetical protein